MPDYSRISCTACSAGPCNSAIRGTCWLGPPSGSSPPPPSPVSSPPPAPHASSRRRPCARSKIFFRRPHAHRRDVFCSGIGILPMMSAHHGQDARATFSTQHIVSARTPLQGARASRRRPARHEKTSRPRRPCALNGKTLSPSRANEVSTPFIRCCWASCFCATRKISIE